jgi:D-alanyl-D-alanine carboxypeptidase
MRSAEARTRNGRASRGFAIVTLALVAATAAGAHRQLRIDDGAERIGARDAAEIAALEKSVSQIVERSRADKRLPGVSAAFALPDGRVGAAVAGFADVEAEARMTPETRFLAGSVGKSFHAALAVALARDGIVDLDAPISRWLGREPWFARLPNAPDLTLRHLLQHRSGLIDHVFSFQFFMRQIGLRMFHSEDAVFRPEELIEIALDRKPKFRAGAGFAYGDTNYVLAGLVIERATGRSPFDQIEERFLAPLGLAEITPARTRRIEHLAAGYQLPLNPFLLPPKMTDENGLRINPMLESTAGGFATTPRDLVRWGKALFEARVLPPDAAEELTRHSVASGDGRRYGLGVYVYQTPIGSAWGHGGYFPGYRSALMYFPESKIAVAAEANYDLGGQLEQLVVEIARTVQGDMKRYAANAR